MSDEERIELYNKVSNLEAENERLKLQLTNFEENVTNIISQFWCWYASVNHKRDLSRFEEGKKYANNFFNDLIKEVGNEKTVTVRTDNTQTLINAVKRIEELESKLKYNEENGIIVDLLEENKQLREQIERMKKNKYVPKISFDSEKHIYTYIDENNLKWISLDGTNWSSRNF